MGEARGERADGQPEGTSQTYFLSTFGRPARDTVCACEVDTEPSLSQALHLINGDSVDGKVRGGDRVEDWLAQGRDAAWILNEIYTSCLSREPTAEERAEILGLIIEGGGDRQEVLEDLFWAVLGSPEFLFQH